MKLHLIRRLLLLLLALPLAALAQDPLQGTWLLVAADTIQTDGSRVPQYGPQPQGLLIFDGAGRYAMQIYASGRTPFASGDKTRGTAEEYRAVMVGSNSHFGRYSVNAAGTHVRFVTECASFPNWEGRTQERDISIDHDHLRYTVPTATNGARGEVEWRRAPDVSH
jgi:hypothetical protein